MLKNIKSTFKNIEQRFPYIPDFSDIWNILKVILVSLFICIIYSFTQINDIAAFYSTFWHNLKIFSPYLSFQLLLLILFAKKIKSLKPTKAILLITVLNFTCVYFIHALSTRSFDNFFSSWDQSLIKLAISCGILFFFLIYFDWREKNLHPSNIAAKLSFLQSKMRPHFLFNTLNSILSLIKKDPDLAKKMIINLSDLLRASLKDNNENNFYSIKSEVALCEKYLEIEQMRLGSRLEVVWNIDESTLTATIPKLSIQPLIENSIIHGVQNLEQGGKIEINIQKNMLNRVNIEIKNPKNDDNHLEKENSNNISLKNLEERLNLLFNYDVQLIRKIEKDFFYIKIDIPKEDYKES